MFWSVFVPLLAQKSITFQLKDKPLKSALFMLIRDHNLSIIFPDTIPNTLISANCNQCDNKEAIASILSSTSLSWVQTGNQFTISMPILRNSFSISGRALDYQSGEPIPFANIYLLGLNKGDISNKDGTFSISNISSTSCSLAISYIGYKTEIIRLSFPKDKNIFQKIYLIPKVLISKEISITGFSREFMDRSNTPGQVSFSPRHISTLPNLGEVDIFRSLQFLPGVQLGLGETSDLYIRGGSPDQNLVILDGMPLYQIGHMFGFISGISSDALKDIQIYKGSIPPQYGGRVSSVIDLSSRTGNNTKPHASFYGNLLSQGLSIEFPFFSKGSWITNFRKSNPSNNYSEIYTSIQNFVTGDDKFNLLSQTANDSNNQNAFYTMNSSYEDIFSRFSLLATSRHRLTYTFISGIDSVLENREYFGFNSILGGDSIHIREKTKLSHQGSIINFSSKWNHDYNSNFSISRYFYNNFYFSQQSALQNNNSFSNVGNAIDNNTFSEKTIRFNHKYKGFTKHTIISGIEENYFSVSFKNNNTDGLSTNASVLKQNSFLHSFYLQDQWQLNKNWDIHSGFRFSYYGNKQEFYLEPRFAIKYKVNPSFSLETSLGKHHQFVHQLSSENNSRWTQSMWIISLNKIPCVISTNYHYGINWDTESYSTSFNSYKRSLCNLFRFQDSFIPPSNEKLINDRLDLGNGFSQGLELLFRKKDGRISGWFSYHLNQTKLDFPSLNNGKVFLADHDKMHEIKLVTISRIFNIDFTATWVFSSGGNYTSKDNLYVEPGSGYEIIKTGNRNNHKLKPTHHLDVSLSKSVKFLVASIDFGCSIYNLYNKNNISHKRYNPYTSEISVTDVSMFGITPTIFFKIKF